MSEEEKEDGEEVAVAVVEELPRYKRLAEAIEQGNLEAAQAIINNAPADDQRRIISQLDLKAREKLCELLPPDETAELLENLTEVQAIELLEELPANIAADVVE